MRHALPAADTTWREVEEEGAADQGPGANVVFPGFCSQPNFFCPFGPKCPGQSGSCYCKPLLPRSSIALYRRPAHLKVYERQMAGRATAFDGMALCSSPVCPSLLSAKSPEPQKEAEDETEGAIPVGPTRGTDGFPTGAMADLGTLQPSRAKVPPSHKINEAKTRRRNRKI